MVRRAPAVLVCGLGLLFGAGPAAASGLEVSPVRVDLSRREANALLMLHNGGSETTRYQVAVVSWAQDASGAMQLAPTQEVLFFPALLTLAPGERRNLRVGAPPERFGGLLEKTYRLLIEELPPLERPDAGPGVRVLTRVSIPVFLEPARSVEEARIEDMAVSGGAVSFRLVNAGSVHVRPEEVRAVALDPSGKARAQQRWDGWYVLPAGERDYRWPLPKDACSSVRSVQIEVALDKRTVRAALKTPEGACG